MSTTFGLHHILFPHPGLYPMGRPPIPLTRGVKVELQPEPKWRTPPILGSGSSNMLGFFDFENFFDFFLPAGTFFFRQRGRERRFFFEKSHMFLAPVKKGGESIFEGIFRFWEFFFEFFWATKGGNDGRRERLEWYYLGPIQKPGKNKLILKKKNVALQGLFVDPEVILPFLHMDALDGSGASRRRFGNRRRRWRPERRRSRSSSAGRRPRWQPRRLHRRPVLPSA